MAVIFSEILVPTAIWQINQLPSSAIDGVNVNVLLTLYKLLLLCSTDRDVALMGVSSFGV